MDSGSNFKKIVKTQLSNSRIKYQEKYLSGYKPGTTKKFIADFYIELNNKCGVVSCIYQDVSGSAQEKHAYKYMCVNQAIFESKLDFGIIVLFGLAKDSPILKIDSIRHLIHTNKNVIVLTHEEFTKRLIRKTLFKQDSKRGRHKTPARGSGRGGGLSSYQPTI